MPAPKLTDDELMAQRARRLGRAPNLNRGDDGGAGPGSPRAAVNPLLGLGDDASDDTPEGDPPATPQSRGAEPPATDLQALLAQIGSLQSQLDATQGRVAPGQQQIEELRQANAALLASNASLTAQVSAASALSAAARARDEAAAFDPFESMSADQLAMLDPNVVDATRLAARAALAKATAAIKDPQAIVEEALAARDTRQLKAFLDTAAAELGLGKLATNAKFGAWSATDDSADILLNSFLRAPNLDTARGLLPRVKTMLKRFEKATADSANGEPNADPATRLSEHLARTPSGAASDGAPRKGRALTPDEAARLRREHSAAIRRRDTKTAAAIMAQLNG